MPQDNIVLPGQGHIGPGLRIRLSGMIVVPTSRDVESAENFRAFVERTSLQYPSRELTLEYCSGDLTAFPGANAYGQPVHRGMTTDQRHYVADHIFNHFRQNILEVRQRSEQIAAAATVEGDRIDDAHARTVWQAGTTVEPAEGQPTHLSTLNPR